MKHLLFFQRIILLVVVFLIIDFILSVILINGLNKYYGFTKDPEILISGSSMVMSGFNKRETESITSKQVSVYAHEGVSVSDRYVMINHFFSMFPSSVRTVIYEVNPVLFSNIETSDNSYTIFYPYMDNKAVDRYIKEKAGLTDYYLNNIIRTKRFDSRLIVNIAKGYLGIYDDVKTNTLDTVAIIQMREQTGKVNVKLEKANLRIFENTIDTIRSHNASIILVMMPMYYLKLQTFNKDGYNSLCQYLENYCLTRKEVNFLNLNENDIIMNADYFSDPLHFNRRGQRQITNLMGSYLNRQK